MTAPIAWGLLNPKTGKLDARLYQHEDSAKQGATRHSNRWRPLVAVPLFLEPSPVETLARKLLRLAESGEIHLYLHSPAERTFAALAELLG